jgi:hypothetical protein
MSFTQTFNFSWTDGATPLTASVVTTGSLEQNFSGSVAANTANNALSLDWTSAALQSVWMSSNQAVTIKTNNTSAPQDTIVLAANQPLAWYTGSGATSPFSNNVTEVYATNGTNTNAAVNLRILTN